MNSNTNGKLDALDEVNLAFEWGTRSITPLDWKAPTLSPGIESEGLSYIPDGDVIRYQWGRRFTMWNDQTASPATL